MAVAETGKTYKFHKGGKFKIIDIRNEIIIYKNVKTKEQYSISKEFWESIALNDKNKYVERFQLCE